MKFFVSLSLVSLIYCLTTSIASGKGIDVNKLDYVLTKTTYSIPCISVFSKDINTPNETKNLSSTTPLNSNFNQVTSSQVLNPKSKKVKKTLSIEGVVTVTLYEDGTLHSSSNEEFDTYFSKVSDKLHDIIDIQKTDRAFAALRSDGSVVSWGDPNFGGDSSVVSSDLKSGVRSIIASRSGFIAIKEDGSIVDWSDRSWIASFLKRNYNIDKVKDIISNGYAYAALTLQGSVIVWGDPEDGGELYDLKDQLSSGVVKIIGTNTVYGGAFVALKDDGSVITWGDPSLGGNPFNLSSKLKSGVKDIFATSQAFCALKYDGTVISWGNEFYGGNSSKVKKKLTHVNQIYSNETAFIAVKDDTTAIGWGDTVGIEKLMKEVNKKLQSSISSSSTTTTTPQVVQRISYPYRPIVTLYSDGSVTAIEKKKQSKNRIAFSEVAHLLKSGVKKLYYDETYPIAIAALKYDGTVVTWGSKGFGGDSSKVSHLLVNVKEIYGNTWGFAALRSDGAVICWGDDPMVIQFNKISDKLSSGVIQLVITGDAYAALKEDGTVITWGTPSEGGDSSEVSDRLVNVKKLYSNHRAFVAVKEDGTAVGWGRSSYVEQLLNDLKSAHKIVDKPSTSTSTKLDLTTYTTVTPQIVKTLTRSDGVSATLYSDGSIISKNDPERALFEKTYSQVAHLLKSDVIDLYATSNAFTALKSDGSAVTWGEILWGTDSSYIDDRLTSGIIQIVNTLYGFAALKIDGSVIIWGNMLFSTTAYPVKHLISSGVKSLISNDWAVAAIKDNGSVVSWGNDEFGGDSSSVFYELSRGVKKVVATGKAFSALKEDGTVISWGSKLDGGDNSFVSDQLVNVVEIYSGKSAFVAQRKDGSLIGWGDKKNVEELLDELHKKFSSSTNKNQHNTFLDTTKT